MSLGQQIIENSLTYSIDNFFFVVIGVTIWFMIFGFYSNYFRINKDTNDIDLMARYCHLQLLRRYKL